MMRKRVVVTAICLLCLISQMIGTIQAEPRKDASVPMNGNGNYPPPALGNWIINMPTYVGNETIDLKGNLSILAGASLTLWNVTLKMNCTADWQRHIEVLNGGVMKILDLDNDNTTLTDASNITSTNPSYEFNFWVRPTATFEMRNSVLTECGEFAGGVPEWEGLYIQTDDAIVDHCKINNCTRGIVLYGSDAVVSNNTIEWCDTGVWATAWSNGVIENNFINWNKPYGIQVDGVDTTKKWQSNPIIRNTQIIDSGQGTPGGVGLQLSCYGCPILDNVTILRSTEDGIYFGQGSQATLNNTLIDPQGGNFAIASSACRYVDIDNSTIGSSIICDMSIAGSPGSFFTLTNTSFNASHIAFGDPFSNLTVRWFLHIFIKDNYGNLIPGANLHTQDNANDTYDQNLTTDAIGYLNWTVLKEYYQNQSTIIDYNPYNLTISKPGYSIAYVELEMNESKSITIILSDIQPPNINHSPVTLANIGQPINITANITDNAVVDAVYLNYTGVNSTNYNVSMNKWNGNWSCEIPSQNDIGLVYYFIWCNDTSGNSNQTIAYQIQIYDITDPEINHIPIASANVFNAINITANITDDIVVNFVFLNYTGVNGTNYNVSMNKWGIDYSYDIPGQASTGIIEYFIWANDTSDNDNMTTINQIQISDITEPKINHAPVLSKNIGETINITANITDDVGVNIVYLNYTDVHGVNQNITMNKWNGNYCLNIPGQSNSGFVSYFIWANDSSDNDNRTIIYQIQIFDVTDPEINHVPITSANVSEIIIITANVTDDVSVNSIYLNYTGVNGTNYNVSMNKLNGNYSYEIPGQNTIGIVQYFIWADDSDGNDNRTIEYSVQINDVVKPKINHVPVVSANIGETINITVNVTDDVSVDAVYLNYTGINGTNDNVTMHRWNGNWSFEIIGQNIIGIVSYFIWVNDTSGNDNQTQVHQVQINDVVKPKIEHTPVTFANINKTINVTAKITDDVKVESVYLNYTDINGINHNDTMIKWNGNWSYEIPGQLSVGNLTYFVWANDTSGNANQTSIYQVQINDVITPDTTPPTILLESPTGINVSVSTSIIIKFDEPMNITSAQNAIIISPAIAVSSYSWNTDNTTLTITLSANLSYNTTYNITVGTGTADLTGNNLASVYSWEFMTELKPVANNPDDGGIGEYWWIIIIIVAATMIGIFFYWQSRKNDVEEEPEEEIEEEKELE